MLFKGELKQAGGFTRDVSSAGTYVVCERGDCMAAGTGILIQLMLPPMGVEGHGMKLQSNGHVVRVGGPGEQTGFAVRADFGVSEDTRAKSTAWD